MPSVAAPSEDWPDEIGRAEAEALAELADYMRGILPVSRIGAYLDFGLANTDDAAQGATAYPGRLIWDAYERGEHWPHSDFCRLMRETPEGERRCVQCDRDAMERARIDGGAVVYDCHAGLTDVAAPVWREHSNAFIGVFLAGQVLRHLPSEKRFREIWRLIRDIPGLDRAAMREAYFRLPNLTQRQSEQARTFLSLFAAIFALLETKLALSLGREESRKRASRLARRALAEWALFDPDLSRDAFLRAGAAVGLKDIPGRVLAVEMEPPAKAARAADEASAAAMEDILAGIDKSFPEEAGVLAGVCGSHAIAVLVPALRHRSVVAEQLRLADIGARVREAVEKASGARCRVGIGVQIGSLREIAGSYRSALHVLRTQASSWHGVYGSRISPEERSQAKVSLESVLRLFQQGRHGECKAELAHLLGASEAGAEALHMGGQMFLLRAAEALQGAARSVGVEEAALEEMGEEFAMRMGGARRASQFLEAVSRLIDRLGEEVERSSGDPDAARVRRAMNYMREHLDRKISLAEVARQAAWSPGHFARMFKRVTGDNFHDTLLKMRIDLAKRWMEERNIRTGDAASALAFSSESTFARAFRRTTGTSPAEYRRAHRR